MRYSASIRVRASRATVLHLLLRVTQLPLWNPAISSVDTSDNVSVAGKSYAAVIRGVLPAVLTYSDQGESGVSYSLKGLGASETGRWILAESTPGRTLVTHEFEHHGLLLRLMRNAFAQVPAWRVGRLKQAVESSR